MKEIGIQNLKVQEKTLFGWWNRLSDYCWELFKYNLWYLLFALPIFLSMIVFLYFNAHLFLLVALALMIPAGPAMLALYKATAMIAMGEFRCTLPHFLFMYKLYKWRGIVFSLTLGIIGLVTLYPVYFVLITNSGMKIVIMICAMITLLLLYSLLPHVVNHLISGERGGILKKSIVYALENGKACFFAGLIQVVWLYLCLLYSHIAIFAILLGMPALVRYTVFYLISAIQEDQ
jgi:hypothetical protein